jgi:hypothetical protein
MARKKGLSAKQIVALLGMGGSTAGAADPLQVLFALAQNPQALTSLRRSGMETVQEASRFDPLYEYDPSTNVNEVLMRYRMMPAEYQPLVNKFFNTGSKVGGNEAAWNAARKQLLQDETLGLDTTARSGLLDQMWNDRDKFINQEAKRQKSQYAAFMKMRKEKGFTSMDPDVATEQYLSAQTGVKGLSELPTTIEELAKQKTEQFRAALQKSGKGTQKISELADQFSKQFLVKAKEKKINPSLLGVSGLIKKNLLGG